MDKTLLNEIFNKKSKFKKDNNIRELKELEKLLDVKFSKSLRKYVLYFMYKIPGCLDMFSYLLGDYKSKNKYECLYKTTIDEREWGDWGTNFVIFSALGNGDFFAIDCKCDKVVLLNHETMKVEKLRDDTLAKIISTKVGYCKNDLSENELLDLKYIIKELK